MKLHLVSSLNAEGLCDGCTMCVRGDALSILVCSLLHLARCTSNLHHNTLLSYTAITLLSYTAITLLSHTAITWLSHTAITLLSHTAITLLSYTAITCCHTQQSPCCHTQQSPCCHTQQSHPQACPMYLTRRRFFQQR